MRLRYGQELSNETDSAIRSPYTKVRIIQVIEQNPIAYQNDSEKLLISSVWNNTLQYNRPMPLINYYIYAEDEKAGSGIGKGLCWRHWLGLMYPHFLTEDKGIFFEAGSDGALFEKYDGQPVIWNDRRGSQLREELGVSETFITFLTTTPTSQSRI